MVMDENVQSLQEGNHNVTLLGMFAEQRASQIVEGRTLLFDCTNRLQSEHQEILIGTSAVPKGQWK